MLSGQVNFVFLAQLCRADSFADQAEQRGQQGQRDEYVDKDGRSRDERHRGEKSDANDEHAA
ncbi:hypothetical protein KCTCHS21_50030 [Cohnella abietis]|uniref:Uncharacterized protein n=1 Tax=Cohnella abietis TaxID=2507935 RepID=A0A3T1DC37_9BACL|nr:hypothetical protein KCTCHS21_50030 [Cohnella abietis]